MKNQMKNPILFILMMLMLSSHSLIFSQTLVFEELFKVNGAPDPTKWVYETGYHRNNELQWYTNREKNVRVINDKLELIAYEETVVDTKENKTYKYTSGSIETKGKFSFKYGKLIAKIKFPLGQGLWPAFWTVGVQGSGTWPANGEIDIMEHVNSENVVHGTCHWTDQNNIHKSGPLASYGPPKHLPLDFSIYHNYAINWTPSSITWSVDGTDYASLNILNGNDGTTELNWAHYIKLNFAVGGNWPHAPNSSTVFPQTMYVDWVRVYNNTSTVVTASSSQKSRNNTSSVNVDSIQNSPFKFISNGENCNVIFPEKYSEMNLCVFDMTGRKLLTKQILNSDSADVDISTLNKGMYIIRIMTGTNDYSGAFIKN